MKQHRIPAPQKCLVCAVPQRTNIMPNARVSNCCKDDKDLAWRFKFKFVAWARKQNSVVEETQVNEENPYAIPKCAHAQL